jgi:HEAT repeat protein
LIQNGKSGRLPTLIPAASMAILLGLAGCASRPGNGAVGHDRLITMPGAKAQERYSDPLLRSELRERAIADLIVLCTDADPQIRANAVEALIGAPARIEAVVTAALQDENVGVRTVGAMTAGRLRLAGTVPAIQPLLDDPSPFVRAAAIYGLRRCGGDDDPTPLATMLLSDPSMRVRAHAAVILGELGDPSAVGLLKQAAKDPMARADQAEARLLRLQIAEALVKLGVEDQVEPIRAALYPSRPEELEATALAVQIIGQVGDRAAAGQLISLARQRNEAGQAMPAEVRLGVAAALAKLGKPEGSFIAEEFKADRNPILRAQAAYVYGETGQLANLARLEALLGDPAPAVRVTAAGAVLRVTDRTGAGAAVGRAAVAGGS